MKLKYFAIVAIILPLSLSGCAAGYSSQKGWYVGTDIRTQDVKAVIAYTRK